MVILLLQLQIRFKGRKAGHAFLRIYHRGLPLTTSRIIDIKEDWKCKSEELYLLLDTSEANLIVRLWSSPTYHQQSSWP